MTDYSYPCENKNNNKMTNITMKQTICNIKIGDILFDELYDNLTIEVKDKEDIDDYFDKFLLEHANNDSLQLLSDPTYYVNGIMKDWDFILNFLYDCEMLNDIEPRHMTKTKITQLFLYQVCVAVIDEYKENKKQIDDDSDLNYCYYDENIHLICRDI